MPYNEEFLEIIKKDWEGTAQSLEIMPNKPPQPVMWPRYPFSPERYLIDEMKSRTMDANFKVNKNGLKINLNNNENLKVLWKDITSISKVSISEILIERKNKKSITISAPYVKGILFNQYYTDEFISYVKKQIKEFKRD